MKQVLIISLVAGVAAFGSIGQASAGCVTGAVVGGVAGHMVGHGGVGAAAGCAYGAHKANKKKAAQSNTAAPSQTDQGK